MTNRSIYKNENFASKNVVYVIGDHYSYKHDLLKFFLGDTYQKDIQET